MLLDSFSGVVGGEYNVSVLILLPRAFALRHTRLTEVGGIAPVQGDWPVPATSNRFHRQPPASASRGDPRHPPPKPKQKPRALAGSGAPGMALRVTAVAPLLGALPTWFAPVAKVAPISRIDDNVRREEKGHVIMLFF